MITLQELYIQIQTWDKHYQEGLSLMAGRRKRLEEYAAKPNANPQAVSIQTEEFNRFMLVLEAAEDTINALLENQKTAEEAAFRRGYDKAVKQNERSTYERFTYHDKESVRGYNIQRTMRDLPHLYSTDPHAKP